MFFPFVIVQFFAGVEIGEPGLDVLRQLDGGTVARIAPVVLWPQPVQDKAQFLAQAALLRVIVAVGSAVIRRPGELVSTTKKPLW